MITVKVNNEVRKIEPQTTIRKILEELKIPREGSAIAVNDKVVPRSQHEIFHISDGDRIEIITAVGGG